MELISGQNTTLINENINCQFLFKHGTHVEVDLGAFVLDSSGKITNDNDFIFFNKKNHDSNGLVFLPSEKLFSLNLSKLPKYVEKVVITATVSSVVNKASTISEIKNLSLSITSDSENHTFNLDTISRSEVSVIMGEIYERNGAWKFKALGHGYIGGLKPLAESFGVDVAQDESTQDKSPPMPKVEEKKISLSKITLDKSGSKISLEKNNNAFGEMLVNLNWEQGKKGFFGGGAIDLDLGCMFEFHDGYKGVIQALGKNFGSLQKKPYIELDGDDRSGENSAGENLRINGDYWQKIQRVMVFAFIYEGAADWSKANARIKIKAPDQPEISINLDRPNNQSGFCACAIFTNVSGNIELQKEERYFEGHKEADDYYKFGFSWKSGSK